mgnify:CR=1 FL=1
MVANGGQCQKNPGTIQRIFEELQKKNIVNDKSHVLCLDSTSIKVHPDVTRAIKTNGKQNFHHSL